VLGGDDRWIPWLFARPNRAERPSDPVFSGTRVKHRLSNRLLPGSPYSGI